MNKTVDKHLEDLINFYSTTDIVDSAYLKKLFVRNLKDVLNRYNKYVIPDLLDYKDSTGKLIKEVLEQQHKIDKAIEYIKEHIRIDDEYPDYMEMLLEERNKLLEILGDKEKEIKNEE